MLNGHACPLPILKVYTSCRTNIHVKVVLTDTSQSLTVIRTGVDQHYTGLILQFIMTEKRNTITLGMGWEGLRMGNGIFPLFFAWFFEVE